MEPVYVIAGKLNREYVLPPAGQPALDIAGGSLLYAAGGLAVWDKHIGLLSRVGEDYPRQWLHEMEERGLDISGVRIQQGSVDLRTFIAYTNAHERSQSNPVSHFARRQMTFPKSLLGYQPAADKHRDPRESDPLAPAPLDVPIPYRKAEYVHLCPMEFISQSLLVNVFRSDSTRTLSLDPSAGYMLPEFWRDLRQVLQGVTIFLPAENELRNLFWGESNDLWQMAEAICSYGPGIVIIKRAGLGQYVFEAASQRRWDIPAYPAARFADPTGVGDAFCGGFMAGYRDRHDPVQAALYGNISASIKIEGSGPFYPLEVMPGLAEARLQSLQELIRAV